MATKTPLAEYAGTFRVMASGDTIPAAIVPTLNQNTTGSAASATVATRASELTAVDDRDVKPNETGIYNNKAVKPFFVAKAQIEGGSGSDYADFLVLDTYSDSSGGKINALLFVKNGTQAIYHYRATWASAAWDTPKQIAYTDSDITGSAALLNGQPASYYLDSANLTGTIPVARSWALTGDVTSPAGSGATTLANSGVTAGTYTKVTVDAKGRVTTGASLAAGDVPTLNQNTTGSAATLTTARTLTIGSTGKTFNGSANVSWSLAEIGAIADAPSDGTTYGRKDGTWVAAGGGSKVTGTTITGASNTLGSGNLNTLVEYVGTTYGAGVYIPTGLGTHADIINILNAHLYGYDLYLYPQSGVTLYKGGASVSSVIIKANTLFSIVRMSAANKWLVM